MFFSALTFLLATKVLVYADNPPYGCSCIPGNDECVCSFRPYDTCVTQSWCQWTGDIPRGCACKSSSPVDCECAFRGSETAAHYDDCVGQDYCEWKGPKPYGCLCKELGESECHCYFRDDHDNCVGQDWCDWNPPPPKPQAMSDYVASWKIIGSGTKITFESGASWSEENAHEFSSSFSLGMETGVEVGFEGFGKVSTKVSTSITTGASQTLSKTKGGETKIICDTPSCDNGNIYQWQLSATDDNQQLWSVSNCNFVCIDNSFDPDIYFPKCPMKYCVTSNDMLCQCCNGDWSDDPNVNLSLKTVEMGGQCTFSLKTENKVEPVFWVYHQDDIEVTPFKREKSRCRKAKKAGKEACENLGCVYTQKYRKRKDKWIVKCKAQMN